MRVSLAHIFNCAALVALVGTATMQGAQQATFHLSAPTHWGQAVLPAGDYKLLAPALSLGRVGFRVEGEGKTIYQLPIAIDYSQQYSKTSYLELSEIDGSYFVHEFSSGATGKTFTFFVPKASHHQEMTKARETKVVLSGM